MLARVISHVRHPSFGFGFVAGILVLLAGQWALPDPHYHVLTYNGVGFLLRVNPWTGDVEWLASGSPRMTIGPPSRLRPVR